MKKRINLNGQDLYYAEDILKFHNVSSTFFQRKEVAHHLIHFGTKIYLTKENYLRYDRLATLEDEYYTLVQVIAKLHLEDYTLNNVDDILSQVFYSQEYMGHIFYEKSEIDAAENEYASTSFPISTLLSKHAEEPVIFAQEFLHYAHNKKIPLLGMKNAQKFAIPFLFSPSALTYIFDNLCICADFSEIDNLLYHCSQIDIESLFDNYIPLDPNKPKTHTLMRDFFFARINKSHSPRTIALAVQYIKDLAPIYSNTYKEIFYYSVQQVYTDLFTQRWCNTSIGMKFLQYVKKNCDYGFASGINFLYKANNKPTSDDIYDYNDWLAAYDYINHIELHIKNAYANRNYAQYWFIMMCYFTSAIRIIDILNVGSLGLDDTRYIERDILLTNPLSLGEAQGIVNTFKNIIESTLIVKTSAHKHFIVHLPMVEAMGTAIAILEYHRIKNDDNNIFTIRNVAETRIRDKFPDLPIKFVTTKATKTLLTYTHNELERSGTGNAYALISSMRSHKSGKNSIFSETTSIYLQHAKLDGDIQNIAWHVCSRGAFGWLYLAMLAYTGGRIGSLEEATTQIDSLKHRISAESLENLSGFLNEEQLYQKQILHEIGGYTKGNIETFLKCIGTSFAASKTDTIFCIKGKYCATHSVDDCLFCRYSVPTTYTLKLLGDRLIIMLDELQSIPFSDTIDRAKLTYFIQRALFILMDAKESFDKYDPKFIQAFVDLPQIKEKLNVIPDMKFIPIE